jgi:hypothetical protein
MQPTTSFHTIKRGTIAVTDENSEPPRTWQIRDDTPTEIILQYLDVQMRLQAYGDLQQLLREDPAQAKAAIAEADHLVTEYLLAIFQFSYPETTLAEIQQHFAYEDRQNLAALFFIRRMQRFSTQPDPTLVGAVQEAQRHASASKTSTPPKPKR